MKKAYLKPEVRFHTVRPADLICISYGEKTGRWAKQVGIPTLDDDLLDDDLLDDDYDNLFHDNIYK